MNMTQKNQKRQTSRRHFLRGAGVALALPWMESLPLHAQSPASNKTPVRYLDSHRRAIGFSRSGSA